ncbi:84e6dfea-f671-4216-8f7a-43988f07a060-CDS [Sclerotinia trifoliorum]|uniref:84e6dfea-f671-4216-8f7a-43988f07a060-CDS n=1 Tax=Sclerotinia trifoliorum TaxID=28548 RepID=A0A8H2VXB2_9HELO|nr:84e6dfea-f671-4216-8f7a-43988f07a060-CDS [Sclerotinia trifoliorum]
MFTIRSISSSRYIQIPKIKTFHPTSTYQQQTRTIKLFTYAATPSKVGLQKLAEYKDFILSDPESCQVELIDPESIEFQPSPTPHDKNPTIATIKPNPIIQTTTLKSILENHMQDGTFLAPREDGKGSNQYYLQKIPEEEISHPEPTASISRGLKSAPGGDASARRVKLFPFHAMHDWYHVQRQLRIARAWLQSSKRAVVEIHVCIDRKKNAVKDAEAVAEIPRRCLHFRPDVIVRAMPKGTKITIQAQTNGEYCWVMGRRGGM